ncbi:patatin-like phospholipase family protein [Actinoplanes sp. NPDC049265]|uniref:patatin-like phospholipase family protein n=1 Tax=Actinoplanes sp. NPDC049265 TaxID=3363902 RepID=UPI00371D02F1
MRRAVVLGGGGPVGLAWEMGLIDALGERGAGVGDADLVVGTSAGAVAGAYLTLGEDTSELLAAAKLPVGAGTVDLAAMQAAMLRAIAGAAGPVEALQAIGRAALAADTMPEEAFLAHPYFARLVGRPWPESFRCTTIDALTGEFRVWSAADGVELHRAVAASCAVPTVIPPITVGGAPQIDGGMRTPLNAHTAEHATSVLAISCYPLDSPDRPADPILDEVDRRQHADLAALRAAGAEVTVIEPDLAFQELSGRGLHVLDGSRAPRAYELGRAHG